MDDPERNENPFLKLYMKQLSLNSDVLSSILSRLFTVGKAWTILTQDLRLRVLEEEELSTDLDHRANISEGNMAAPYVTVRGEPAPPKPAPQPKETTMIERRDLSAASYDEPKSEGKAKADATAIFLSDADKVEQLLDIIQSTVNMSNIPCIRAAAQNELAQIERDLWEQMYPEQAKAEKKAQEEREKAEAEAQKRIKEQQEKERKKQAELQKEEADAA